MPPEYSTKKERVNQQRVVHVGALISALGIAPDCAVALEVVGRRSGKPTRFPLVMVSLNGERYLMSMLGNEANWVRNLQVTGGRAVLLHGRREEVILQAVDVAQRAPIPKAYLRRAPGARPRMAVSKDAPLAKFAQVAAAYPVFRVKAVDNSPDFALIDILDLAVLYSAQILASEQNS